MSAAMGWLAPDWQPFEQACLSGALREWLGLETSLTEQLARYCGQALHSHVLAEALSESWPEEAALLGVPLARGWLREIHLCSAVRPWVFGRTFIPLPTLEAISPRLDQLGQTPLGQVLFQIPGLQRRDLQVAPLDARHRLYQHALAGLPGTPQTLWARRSVLAVAGSSLLVTEVFLPGGPLENAA